MANRVSNPLGDFLETWKQLDRADAIAQLQCKVLGINWSWVEARVEGYGTADFPFAILNRAAMVERAIEEAVKQVLEGAQNSYVRNTD